MNNLEEILNWLYSGLYMNNLNKNKMDNFLIVIHHIEVQFSKIKVHQNKIFTMMSTVH